jgi:hypothetical protein
MKSLPADILAAIDAFSQATQAEEQWCGPKALEAHEMQADAMRAVLEATILRHLQDRDEPLREDDGA